MRINGQALPDTLYLDGQKTDIVITEINGYASFEIPSCGFYELKYRENAPQKSLPIRKSAPSRPAAGSGRWGARYLYSAFQKKAGEKQNMRLHKKSDTDHATLFRQCYLFFFRLIFSV